MKTSVLKKPKTMFCNVSFAFVLGSISHARTKDILAVSLITTFCCAWKCSLNFIETSAASVSFDTTPEIAQNQTTILATEPTQTAATTQETATAQTTATTPESSTVATIGMERNHVAKHGVLQVKDIRVWKIT